MHRFLKKVTTYVFAVVAITFLGGCSTMTIQDYADKTPKLIPSQDLVGEFTAHGIFIDRFKALRRSFTVDIVGTWDDDTRTLTLDEKFVYDDGERQHRIWTLVQQDEHTYTATANDIEGEQTVKVYGNTLNMTYNYPIKTGGRTIHMTFDDWIHKQSDDVLLNRTHVTKWGLRVGELLISFNRK